MRTPADVLVVGDALLDIRVVPGVPPRRGEDVPAAIELGAGGQGANLAIRLARRGLGVRLRCALAEDAAGSIVRRALATDGGMLEASATEATGTVVLLLDPDGERTMLSHRTPLLPMAIDQVAAWTMISGYVLLEDADLELAGEGRRAVVGCALTGVDAGGWWRRIQALRPQLLVLNAVEARAVGADARTLAQSSGGVVVVTEPGGAGAAMADGTLVHATTDQLVAVDTTGAGDAFASTLLAELFDVGWPPPPSVLEAAIASAATVAGQVSMVMGAQARVPAEGRPMPA
jgi:ribokinase